MFVNCLFVVGFPVINDPLYNHVVFGPTKGKGGLIGKSDDQLIQDLIAIHNAENWLGMDGDSELSMFNKDAAAGSGDTGNTNDCAKKSATDNSNDENGMREEACSPASTNGNRH